jgi:hypothetical protein
LDLDSLAQVEGRLRLSLNQHEFFRLFFVFIDIVDLFKGFSDVSVNNLLYFWVEFPLWVGDSVNLLLKWFDGFQVVGGVEHSSYGIFFAGCLDWKGDVLRFDVYFILLFVEVQNRGGFCF